MDKSCWFIRMFHAADLLRRHGGKHGTIHSAIGGGDVDPVTLSEARA
jgi:hypothetical protein